MCSGQTERSTASEEAPQTLSQMHKPRNTRGGSSNGGGLAWLPGPWVHSDHLSCWALTAWAGFCQYLDFDEKLTLH